MIGDVRWGIIGTGFAAAQFAAGLSYLSNTRISAVASRSEERAAEFARHFSVAKSYRRYEELMSDDDVDVVYVASVNPLHREHCLLALEAGKAVLCEKPFALNGAQAREVVALARQRRIFCMEALRTRFLPAVIELRKLVLEGAIGTPQALNASIGHRSAFEPAGRLFNSELGGGALLDLGVYPLSLAVMLFGRPENVKSQAIIGASNVDEEWSAILAYSRGRMASVSATLRADMFTNVIVTGSSGLIEMNAPLYWSDRLSIVLAPPVHSEPSSQQSALPRSGLMTRFKAVPRVRASITRAKFVLEPIRKLKAGLIVRPYSGNGFTAEASEVISCLKQGFVESKLSPLDDTIVMMEIMDDIREQWSTKE
jgi:predicted dehydrogenase